MKALKVEAQPRQDKGTAAMGRLRRKGFVPAVVYGAGRDNLLIQLNEHDFIQILKGHASENLIMDLEVAGEKQHKVLLKDVQHHPVTGNIIHADFYEISMTQKLRVEIPLRLVGDPVGVTQQGGILEHLLRAVTVECLPADIIESFDVDVAALDIGHSLSVSDVKLDTAKYTVISAADLAVARVAAPRAEEEVAPEAAAEGAAEPEVLTEKKVEGEEGAEEGEAKKGGKEEGKKPGKDEAKKPEAAAKEEPKKGAKEAAPKKGK